MIAALEHVLQSAQEVPCAKCGAAQVTTRDAIGRTRQRCPKCDGVAAPKRPNPNETFMPQALVPVHSQLPPIAPGQLRCQRCACGVEGRERFCAACVAEKASRPKKHTNYIRKTARVYRPAAYKPKVCARDGCDTTFTPRGPRARFCEVHQ